MSSDLPKLPFNKHKGNSLKRRYCHAEADAATDGTGTRTGGIAAANYVVKQVGVAERERAQHWMGSDHTFMYDTNLSK